MGSLRDRITSSIEGFAWVTILFTFYFQREITTFIQAPRNKKIIRLKSDFCTTTSVKEDFHQANIVLLITKILIQQICTQMK